MRVILSISSDIGTALALKWIEDGFCVSGTYRTKSKNVELLESKGAQLAHCDFANKDSIVNAANFILGLGDWEVLVLSAGTQDPIGLFSEIDFNIWESSVEANFLGMVRFLHMALGRSTNVSQKSVIFFAGGATNNATERYSSYTISKIASIKLCELLDFENDLVKFTILGPGWVKTKIHNATLANPVMAGSNHEKTVEMLNGLEMNPMENVIDCCDWVIQQPKSVVGGRNFSVVHDAWGSPNLKEELLANKHLYKLRRFGNELKFTEKDNL